MVLHKFLFLAVGVTHVNYILLLHLCLEKSLSDGIWVAYGVVGRNFNCQIVSKSSTQQQINYEYNIYHQ